MGRYNALNIATVLLFVGAFVVALWGGIIYPRGSTEVTIPPPIPFKSIIPTTQSGIAEFTIPLPLKGWEMPVSVLCILTNLTNAGIYQNVPVELNINITLQNSAAIGAAADEYIYVSWFDVYPVNAIEVSYSPNWDSPTFMPWSYKPRNPAEFSSLWCINRDIQSPHTGTNTEHEVFSDSGEVVLQDTGLLNLQIEPNIFKKIQLTQCGITRT